MTATRKNTTCTRCSRAWTPLSSAEPCPFCRVESLENAVDRFLPRLTQVTARHRHGMGVPRARMDALSNAQIDLEDALALTDRHTRPEFLLSCVFYPALQELEIGVEDMEGNHATMTAKVCTKTGRSFAKLILPCVKQTAAINLKDMVRT